ncbi:glucokinase [Phaeodactylum tricornutum CCAP 1055/1]|jgi:glucokinase|uniref:Glucokinase n=2 Tax=Phaeodactylum tricornutum TaxID=2850 RepID=B7G8B7_PHATC|nr:glucokinase [Phaeodactylum tricornutum CCAP 1055/1]EEC45139.1 glucokinase [Phaeodactylum tricornutum CCAP 1055/1]|eukprot:XP_002183439.1 glucokinase [Phaeodactylum tricornutum CCAP 1055/1]
MTNLRKSIYLLTADVGGTNSRMSLYDAEATCCEDKPLVVKYYRNSEHLTCHVDDPKAFPKHIVIPFLKYCWNEAEKKDDLVPLKSCQIIACFATAGIVSNNKVNMTNLDDLLIDGNAIQNDQKDPYLKHVIVCKIINDFVAQGYGCLTLSESDVVHLGGPQSFPLESLKNGPKVCVGAGTGLGECYLTQGSVSDEYTCFPSEGGHVEYAPRHNLEVRLFEFLNEKFCTKDRISVERVVSGKGLANVYEFLAHEFPERILPEVHDQFLNSGDEQGKIVSDNATEGSLCLQAMSIMMSAYGCEVGSAAIKFIPTGGLFVTGGLTPKNIKYIHGHNTEFMLAYRNKGRVSTLLDRIPLFAVMVEDLGVRGAHKAARMEYERFLRDNDQTNGAVKRKSTSLGKLVQEYAWTSMALSAIAALTVNALLNRKSWK